MSEYLAGLDLLKTILYIVSNKDALDAAVKRLVKARDEAAATEKAAAKMSAAAQEAGETAQKLMADAEAKMGKANLAMQEQGREKALVVTMRAAFEQEKKAAWAAIYAREAECKKREARLDEKKAA